jgi:hypothetical protein
MTNLGQTVPREWERMSISHGVTDAHVDGERGTEHLADGANTKRFTNCVCRWRRCLTPSAARGRSSMIGKVGTGFPQGSCANLESRGCVTQLAARECVTI